MDDIVKDFLIESRENLDRLDQELVQLESDPSSKDLLASIFRTIHTIKGSCGFLGFTRLEKVAHAGESLLSRLRDGKLTLSKEITNGLLATVDAVRQMLSSIEQTGQDGTLDYAALIEQLASLQVSTGIGNDKPVANGVSVRVPAAVSSSNPLAPPESNKSPCAASVEERQADSSKIGGLLVERGQIRPEDLARALEQQEIGRKRIGEILVEQGAAQPEHVLAAQQTLRSRNPEGAVETVRVGVTLLDRLMNLVGELVLARNQLLQFSNSNQDTGLQTVSQRMNLIATELQEEVMKTRMQPIGNIWNKFPRTVRDLALSCGKQVRLEMEGQDTELDRTIIEAIKDPLTHLVRNAIDHGVEAPEVRNQAGKPATGLLKLRSFHEGGQVNIEIADDGAGLNSERIRQKAAERGLVSAQQASRMSDREVFSLIFLPGFSTAEQVTNVSGRGVGMDVVKTNVEKIGGTVDVQSTPGQGTTVRIKIPLTLAIIPALMVTAGGERFAIPQVSLLELVRMETGEAGKGIEMVHGVPVYRLRGRLLPLVYLNRELRLFGAAECQTVQSHAFNIVVVQADGREFGIVVDEITDTEEIVVKPLGKQLKGLTVYSGATIMGDGRVALILDILGLAQRGQVISSRDPASSEKENVMAAVRRESVTGRQTLLVVQCGHHARLAIPLSLVARLEEFPTSAIEKAGPQEVTQYRGQIMPLIRLAQIVSGNVEPETAISESRLQVVVYSETGRSIGLIVDRIVDIVDEKLALQAPAPRPGVLGSSVVQKRVTDLLDVPGLVRQVFPGFAESKPSA